jgi:hypothetical protein
LYEEVLAAGEAGDVADDVEVDVGVVDEAGLVVDDDELVLHPISAAISSTATPPAAMRARLNLITCRPSLSPGAFSA